MPPNTSSARSAASAQRARRIGKTRGAGPHRPRATGREMVRMRTVCALLALSALFLPAAGARAAPEESEPVPVVGRPADLPFSEASGRFEVSARAAPTTLAVEAP